MVIQKKRRWNSLQQMDERHRIVVVPVFQVIRYRDLWKCAIHEGTVHSRLHNAREKLKSALEHLNGE
jgi:hypothetical protein